MGSPSITLAKGLMKLFSPNQIKPRGKHVLIRANTTPYLGTSGLFDPNVSRYPNVGWVEAVGPLADSSLQPNQYVLLESEREDYEGVPVDFFLLIVESVDGLEKIALPIEEEPWLKEVVEAVAKNSDLDRRLQVVDIFTDDTWSLMASDIKHFELTEIPQPSWDLEYVNTHILYLSEGVYYLVEDRHIDCILRGG